jgi:hypothetical protein
MIRLAALLVLAGCMTEVEGDPGVAGPPGETGPAGPGLGLVWKDATGAVVPNAFVLYEGRRFAMVVRDQTGVFFDVSPTSGVFNYATINTSTRYYLTSNCTGEGQQIVDVPPNMAFQFDGRVVVLPPDISVATVARSYAGSMGCMGTQAVGSFVSATTLMNLPTLTPATIHPGPYHVDQR